MLHERIADAERRLPAREVAAHVALGELRGQLTATNRIMGTLPRWLRWTVRPTATAIRADIATHIDDLDQRLLRRGL